jgi:hypothetical protein
LYCIRVVYSSSSGKYIGELGLYGAFENVCFSSNNFIVNTLYITYYKFRANLSPEMLLKVAMQSFNYAYFKMFV